MNYVPTRYSYNIYYVIYLINHNGKSVLSWFHFDCLPAKNLKIEIIGASNSNDNTNAKENETVSWPMKIIPIKNRLKFNGLSSVMTVLRMTIGCTK